MGLTPSLRSTSEVFDGAAARDRDGRVCQIDGVDEVDEVDGVDLVEREPSGLAVFARLGGGIVLQRRTTVGVQCSCRRST